MTTPMTSPKTNPETIPAACPEATVQAATPTIGVFDSGFGGLTVLRALVARLPQARFAFLGDTARLPYGSKSRRTIARYAVQSAQFLVRKQGAQFLVIACNTASALALDAIQEAVLGVPVLGVIAPGVTAARAASRTGDVLVIATDATVQSHAYAVACRAQGLRALEKACPLLVPLVEEGWTDHPVTEQVLEIYLDELNAEAAAQGLSPDTLVLGCTHYPLLRPLLERIIARAIPAGIQVIDSADAAAEAALLLFSQHNMEKRPRSAQLPSAQDQIRCFATDSVDKFERLGSRFLGRPTGKVELVDLGG
ncbi:MAG: glutamate racemase [Terracidiphilus sp.]